MKVQVIENVLKANDEVAALNRRDLAAAGVFCVNLIGAPGSGKTALIEATLRRPDAPRCAVIVGDLATQRDADRIARHCDQVVQINTGQGCHLEAHHVRPALARLDLTRIDLLFIENVGNLICPVGFDLGQHVKVGVFSVAEGDDKPAKHPYLVQQAAALVLSKTDLLPHVPFDRAVFMSDVRQLNPQAPVLELSTHTGEGVQTWMRWLGNQFPARAPVPTMPQG